MLQQFLFLLCESCHPLNGVEWSQLSPIEEAMLLAQHGILSSHTFLLILIGFAALAAFLSSATPINNFLDRGIENINRNRFDYRFMLVSKLFIRFLFCLGVGLGAGLVYLRFPLFTIQWGFYLFCIFVFLVVVLCTFKAQEK